MRSWLFRLFLAVLLAGPVWAAAPESVQRVVLEEIVARVNNEIITLSDLERSRELLREELGAKHSGAELEAKVQEQAGDLLRDLIDQALLVQRGDDLGLSVEAAVIKRLDRIRQNMRLETMEELEQAVTARGSDFEDFRQQLRQQILTDLVIQREVAGKVMVDTEEMRQYYLKHREEMAQPEQFRLREILVSSQDRTPEQLDARTREILEKIRKGEKFDELAKQYSDAPTAAPGGELGYFEPEKLAPAIREVVTKLREEGVSDPLRTREGYLILQLVEHIPAGIPPYEKIKGLVRQKLYFDRVQPALREYLSELRREAFISVRAGYVDTGAVEPPAKPRRRGRRRHGRRRD
ncbi:MAG: peptidylprolyl isomerase [Terriglobia bacterium]